MSDRTGTGVSLNQEKITKRQRTTFTILPVGSFRLAGLTAEDRQFLAFDKIGWEVLVIGFKKRIGRSRPNPTVRQI